MSHVMQIAMNNLLKTLKMRARNENVIINFKKKNFDNLIRKKNSFEKTLRKIKSTIDFYCYKIDNHDL